MGLFDENVSTSPTPSSSHQKYQYPTSWRLGLILLSLWLGTLLVAIDTTIIGTAIPKISTDFQALTQVGWYGSAYMLTLTAFQPIYGNVYKFFDAKLVFLASILLFEGEFFQWCVLWDYLGTCAETNTVKRRQPCRLCVSIYYDRCLPIWIRAHAYTVISSRIGAMRRCTRVRDLHTGPGDCWGRCCRASPGVTGHHHLHIPSREAIKSFCRRDQCLWTCCLFGSRHRGSLDRSHQLAMVFLDVC